jgi:hypothetical protein
MPGHRLNTHVAAQATDHTAEATGETPPLVNKLTVLHAPFILTDKYLGQLHIYHARIAKQRHIPDLSTDIPVDRSLLAGNGVYGVSAPDEMDTPLTASQCARLSLVSIKSMWSVHHDQQ